MQLVAKGLLTQFRQQFHDMKLFGLVKYIAHQAIESVWDHNLLQIRQTNPNHLRDAESHLNAFRHRKEALLTTVTKRPKKQGDSAAGRPACL